jgi:hypothetical protein
MRYDTMQYYRVTEIRIRKRRRRRKRTKRKEG